MNNLIRKQPGVRQKVQFNPKTLGTIKKKLLVKSNKKEVQHLDIKTMHYNSNNTIWSKVDWSRRQIKPLPRYAHINLLIYLLSKLVTNKKIIMIKSPIDVANKFITTFKFKDCL